MQVVQPFGHPPVMPESIRDAVEIHAPHDQLDSRARAGDTTIDAAEQRKLDVRKLKATSIAYDCARFTIGAPGIGEDPEVFYATVENLTPEIKTLYGQLRLVGQWLEKPTHELTEKIRAELYGANSSLSDTRQTGNGGKAVVFNTKGDPGRKATIAAMQAVLLPIGSQAGAHAVNAAYCLARAIRRAKPEDSTKIHQYVIGVIQAAAGRFEVGPAPKLPKQKKG